MNGTSSRAVRMIYMSLAYVGTILKKKTFSISPLIHCAVM
jgi:hypothetical protein